MHRHGHQSVRVVDVWRRLRRPWDMASLGRHYKYAQSQGSWAAAWLYFRRLKRCPIIDEDIAGRYFECISVTSDYII